MRAIVISGAVLAILISLGTVCWGGANSYRDTLESGQVTGLVIEVQGANFSAPDSLIVRDDTQKIWRFAVEDSVTFSTSHIRDHQNRLESVTVYFRETDTGLVAVTVTD